MKLNDCSVVLMIKNEDPGSCFPIGNNHKSPLQ